MAVCALAGMSGCTLGAVWRAMWDAYHYDVSAEYRIAMNETAMRPWWVSDYECYAGRTAQEAFDAAVKDWGGLDDISETVDDVIEAGASETMDLGEDGEGPIVNIRAHAATMGDAGFICGIDG